MSFCAIHISAEEKCPGEVMTLSAAGHKSWYVVVGPDGRSYSLHSGPVIAWRLTCGGRFAPLLRGREGDVWEVEYEPGYVATLPEGQSPPMGAAAAAFAKSTKGKP